MQCSTRREPSQRMGCFSDVALILFMQLFETPPYQFIAAKKHIIQVPTIAKTQLQIALQNELLF